MSQRGSWVKWDKAVKRLRIQAAEAALKRDRKKRKLGRKK